MVTQLRPGLVFAADLHFDETGAWKYRGVVGDAQHSFDQIVEFCCNSGASLLALGGDILDRPNPRPETVKYLRDRFAQLAHHRVLVVYILGQHDGRQDWPSIHPDPVHLHGRRLEVDGFALHGLDYLRPATFLEAYARLADDRPDFLLCHQVWSEFMGNARQAELSMAQLPFALDLLTGDYHIHTTCDYTALDGVLATAYSPGSTHMRDVAEEPEKKFFVFSRGDPLNYHVQSVPLATRPARRIKIATTEQLERFLTEGIHQLPLGGVGIERMVLDVSYYDDLESAAQRLAAALEDRCHLFLRPRRRRRDERPVDAVDRRRAAEGGMAASVPLVCQDPVVCESVIRLLEAPDRRAELAAMKQEFYAEPIEGTDP
jgi:hypothetical protein